MKSVTLKGKALKGFAWSGMDKLLTQGLQFLFSLLMARLLVPEDYGIIGMLAIFTEVANIFVDSGFASALIRKNNPTELDNSTAFMFNVTIALLTYTILFVASPYIAFFYKIPLLEPVLRVLAIGIVLNSLCVVQVALLTKQLNFKLQAIIGAISVIVSGIVGVVLAFWGYGVWALVAQVLIVSFMKMVLLWLFSKWKPSFQFSCKSFKELFGFGSKLLAGGLINTIYNNLYLIVIGKVFSASSLGFYTRATQFVNFPSYSISSVITKVSYPLFSKMQSDICQLTTAYEKLLKMVMYIVFPAMTLLAAVSEPLIDVLLTYKWAQSAVYLKILCFALMWVPMHTINLDLITALGRSDLFLRLEIVKKIVGVSVLMITIPLGLKYMCYGQILMGVISLFINTYYSGRLGNFGFLRQIKLLFPSLICSVVMFLIITLFNHCVTLKPLQLLVIDIFIGFVFYFGISLIRKDENFIEIINILSKK